MFLKFLQKIQKNRSDRKLARAKKDLEQSRQQLSDAVNDTLKNVEHDISIFRDLLEQSRNHGLKKHTHFFNLNVYTSLAHSDIVLLAERIRLTERRFEKLLYSRLLAMIMIEFLDDINRLIGKEFVKELEKNGFNDTIQIFKDIAKQYSKIKNDNESLLRTLRNSTAAHKENDALKLVNMVYNIDSSSILNIGIDIINVTTQLIRQTTVVVEKILEDINSLPR